MNLNSLSNIAGVAASNSPDERAPRSPCSFAVDLMGNHQATTSQSLDSDMFDDSGALDDWGKIRGDLAAPDWLMRGWKCAATNCEIHASDFAREVDSHQTEFITMESEPALVTTALVAHIDQLEVPSRFDALNLLLNSERDLDFDKKKLETLAASRWIECFPDGDRDKVRALIQNLTVAESRWTE